MIIAVRFYFSERLSFPKGLLCMLAILGITFLLSQIPSRKLIPWLWRCFISLSGFCFLSPVVMIGLESVGFRAINIMTAILVCLLGFTITIVIRSMTKKHHIKCIVPGWILDLDMVYVPKQGWEQEFDKRWRETRLKYGQVMQLKETIKLENNLDDPKENTVKIRIP